MEISYLGANCVLIGSKAVKVLIDPDVPGININCNYADIVLLTGNQESLKSKENQLVIDSPGEYEAKGVSVKGIAARSHMEETRNQSSTVYRIDINNFSIGVIGHIYPELNDEQLEGLGTVDMLVIPVGGHGYTLDAEGASKLIKDIEPKIVIPTHYNDNAVKYEVPQGELEDFLNMIGTPSIETSKYKIKEEDLPEQLTIVALSRTSS